MRDEGAVEENRISIRNFWYHGEVDPEDLIFSQPGGIHGRTTAGNSAW
jgi:hypothetical protein